jgi:hypothetical protein
MSLQAQPLDDDADDWMMGGSHDPEAEACMGFSEKEAALAAVAAFQAVTEPGIVATRERRMKVFFDCFRAGVMSYLEG